MAHEGVLCAARMLVASRVGDVIEENICRLPPDYKVVLTGHSLGGAVAILAALLLRQRLEKSSRSGDLARAWHFWSESTPGQTHRRNIVCYAFGPPPFLSGTYDWPGDAGAGVERIWQFTSTCFVNHDDPVPSVCLRSCYELIGDMIAIDRIMPETTLGWWGWVRLLRTGSFLAAGKDNAVDGICRCPAAWQDRHRGHSPS